jgi:hypothetical protein
VSPFLAQLTMMPSRGVSHLHTLLADTQQLNCSYRVAVC